MEPIGSPNNAIDLTIQEKKHVKQTARKSTQLKKPIQAIALNPASAPKPQSRRVSTTPAKGSGQRPRGRGPVSEAAKKRKPKPSRLSLESHLDMEHHSVDDSAITPTNAEQTRKEPATPSSTATRKK